MQRRRPTTAPGGGPWAGLAGCPGGPIRPVSVARAGMGPFLDRRPDHCQAPGLRAPPARRRPRCFTVAAALGSLLIGVVAPVAGQCIYRVQRTTGRWRRARRIHRTTRPGHTDDPPCSIEWSMRPSHGSTRIEVSSPLRLARRRLPRPHGQRAVPIIDWPRLARRALPWRGAGADGFACRAGARHF